MKTEIYCKKTEKNAQLLIYLSNFNMAVFKLKHITFLLLILFQCLNLQSQNSKIDSLLVILSNSKNDSLNIFRYNQLAQEYILLKNYKQASVWAGKSLLIISQNNNNEANIECLLLNAYLFSQKNDLSNSLKYYLKASNIAIKQADSLKISTIYNEIGLIYVGVESYTKASEYFEKSYTIANNNNFEVQRKNSLKNLAFSNKNNKLYDTALENYLKLLEINKSEDIIAEIINTLTNIAYIYNEQKKYEAALLTNKEIYSQLLKTNDIIALSFILNNVAYNCVYLEKFEDAITYFKQSITITNQFKLQEDEAQTYTNIGICYQNLSDNKKAIENLLKAKTIYESIDKYSEVASIDNIIALIYYYSNDFYNAEIYSENSILTAEGNNAHEELKNCYQTYSLILQKANDFENALEYYKKYLNIKDSLLMEERFKEQEIAKRQYDAEKSEKELKLLLANEDMKDLALKQLKLEAEKREKELELLRKDKDVQELEKQRIEQSLILTQRQHEADIREQEILTLEKEKELQKQELKLKEAGEKEQQKEIELLQSEKEKQQLEIENQNAEKRRMQTLVGMFIIILFLILIGMFLVSKKNKKLKKQQIEIQKINTDLERKNEEITVQKENLQQANEEIIVQKENLQQKNEEIMSINEELNVQKEEISQQNILIEKKNKDMTDSIQYAKRIQTVIIPPSDILITYNIEHFILLKPRDIVSGDFYWMKETLDVNNQKHIILTAADCTGHGVPGALMSMLGISYLNEIVGQHRIIEPHIILNKLRDKVKEALQQKGVANEAKDGMDMALISYNLDALTLSYSGANNPIFHVRKYSPDTVIEDDKKNPIIKLDNGIYKLTETRPDKMPVGIYIKENESFTNHSIDIQKGDSIYIFSDGYIDQFGGVEGRKFLTKYFKKLILSIQEKPMEEQKNILEETLKEWLGGIYEQLDDILVIGIKI